MAMRRKRTPPDGVRSLGPVPQRRQAAISVDGAEPHHGEHAAELEQQEPPVSGLPQRAQETDLGVVDPGGDDTKKGEAREPRQALGRLERIRTIVPGEKQGTCRGGQRQEAADPPVDATCRSSMNWAKLNSGSRHAPRRRHVPGRCRRPVGPRSGRPWTRSRGRARHAPESMGPRPGCQSDSSRP